MTVTDVEGVFNKPPHEPGAQRISVFDSDSEIEIGQKSSVGRGGMLAKINAARYTLYLYGCMYHQHVYVHELIFLVHLCGLSVCMSVYFVLGM
jgi:hypothetical protein